MPIEPETYIHRIGRTARAGADGDAISFCSAAERSYLIAIEKLIRIPIPVDLEHSFHCEQSMGATGADAEPSARQQRTPRKKTATASGREKGRLGRKRPSRNRKRQSKTRGAGSRNARSAR